jgi:ABC-type amino acid transport substrate-binding protein
MKKIAGFALVFLVVTATLLIGCSGNVDTETASVTEVSEALMRCYTLQHSPYDPDAFGNFTVKDLQFGNKTTFDLAGHKITVWQVGAKLYDANGKYVQDLEQNMIKMDNGGWVCQ